MVTMERTPNDQAPAFRDKGVVDGEDMKNKTPYELINRLKDPDEIFDLICSANYFCGNFNSPMPVEDSRKAFERIKKLLRNNTNGTGAVLQVKEKK